MSLRRRSLLLAMPALLPGLEANAQGNGQANGQDGPALVAAAADLEFVLEEVATRFRADTGLDVKLVFGSSGNLARQAEQGARRA